MTDLRHLRAQDFVDRIEEAQNVDHEESRQSLIQNIHGDLKPLRDELYRILGKKASDMLRFGEPGEESTIEIETCTFDHVPPVTVYKTTLGDLRSVHEVLLHVKNLELIQAHAKIKGLDSAVRDAISEDVFSFFESLR